MTEEEILEALLLLKEKMQEEPAPPGPILLPPATYKLYQKMGLIPKDDNEEE